MKTLYIKVMLAMLVAFSTNTYAQAKIKNAKTESVTIYGNCGMCENNIETAGNLKKIAAVDWDKSTKLATITYDSKKTNTDEVLKRIALAGYDSDKFLAPDAVYEKLHGCCQYDRASKPATTETARSSMHHGHTDTTGIVVGKDDQLKPVYDRYFELKDALVGSDANVSSAKASALSAAIAKVEMSKLEMDVHMVWMKVLEKIKADTEAISSTKDLAKQRKHFITLSNEMASLIKVSKYDTAVYLQFCPMANGGKGANWISKENAIKNPYYGASMLSCGKVLETIK